MLLHRQALSALLLLVACSRNAQQVERSEVERGFELIAHAPERALTVFSNHQGSPQAQLGAGLAYEALGNWDAAATALSRVAEGAPGYLRARTALARVLLFSGNPERARDELKLVHATAPGDLEVILLLALTAVDAADHESALEALTGWESTIEAGARIPVEVLVTRAALERASGAHRNAQATLARSSGSQLRDPHGALVLASLAKSLGKETLASGLARRVSTSDAPGLSRHTLAELGFDLGDMTIVANVVDRLPIAQPHPLDSLLRGRYLLATGSADKARLELEKALGGVPQADTINRSKAEYLLAQACLQSGRSAEARRLAEELLLESPESVPYTLLLADVELDSKQPSRAVDLLGRVVQRGPERGELIARLGSAQLAANQLAEAEKTFRSWLALEPASIDATQRLANVLTRRGKHAEVAAVFENLADHAPSNVQAHRMLVGHYLARQDAATALRSLELRAERPNATLDIKLLLAATYEKLGKRKQMRSLLESLAQLAADDTRVWVALAQLESLEGQKRQSEAALRKLVTLDPNSVLGHARLGSVLAELGQPELAAQEYERVLQLVENDVIALNNAAALYNEQLGNPSRAVELAERALAVDPRIPQVQDTLGWALFKRGRPADRARAIQLLRSASNGSKSKAARIHYLTALHESGGTFQAIELLQSYDWDRSDDEVAALASLLQSQSSTTPPDSDRTATTL